jgi:hypothetical protein
MKMCRESDNIYGKFGLEKENYIFIDEPYLRCAYFLFDLVEILYLFRCCLQIVVHFLFMIVHDFEVSAKKWKR